HAAGTCMFGKVLEAMSEVVGSGFNAHPCNTSAAASMKNIGRSGISMQLEDQIVGIRADTENHFAHDVNVVPVLRIDRSVTGRSRGEEEVAIAVRNAKPHGEPAWREWRGAGLRDRPGHWNLALALRPDHRVDLRFDDPAGHGVERDLRFVTGID